MTASVWRFVTDFGDTAIAVPLALLMAGFLIASKETRLAVGWSLAILGCAGAIGALKLALWVCGDPFVGPLLASPNGHTAMSIAVYGGFAAVIGSRLPWPGRAALIVGAALLTIGIAVSRAILRYHSPVEVKVGLIVGTATLVAIVIIVAMRPPRQLPVGQLAAAAAVVALLFHGDRWPAEHAIHRLALWFGFLRLWCR